MQNFDSYWDDPSIDAWDRAYEIVNGDPDKMQKYGHPDDWGPETVDKILSEREFEIAQAFTLQPTSDIYKLVDTIFGSEEDMSKPIRNPVIEDAICDTLTDNWMDLSLLITRIKVKLTDYDKTEEEIGDLVSFYSGILGGEGKIEVKSVNMVNSEGYYYMLRKNQ